MASSVISFVNIFQTKISPELMQILENSKQHSYFFLEFYVINLKIKGSKFDHGTTLRYWPVFISHHKIFWTSNF